MRPSIALCMIMRDEVHNLPRLFKSIHGCYDEVHVTDTGSVDGSCEWVKEHGEEFAGCKVFIHHFEWIHDFAAARNYSFSFAKTDYVAWLDLDDELHNPEGFKHWRDHAMQFADGWYANYHYAVDVNKKPIISFIRERVVKNNGSFTWKFFVHEGLIPNIKPNMGVAHVWGVNHLRSEDDFNKDRSRNLKMLEDKRAELPTRLLFYFGKELHDNGKPDDALKVLLDAATKADLDHHDRVLALQYACYSAMQLADQMKPEFQAEKCMLAEKLAKQGLELSPTRAEFHCIIGDCLIKRGNLLGALPHFHAAEGCIRADMINASMMDPIFHFKDCYDMYPKMQKMKIFFHLGMLDKAEELAVSLAAKNAPMAQEMLKEIEGAKKFTDISEKGREKTDAIVFSCPPGNAYPFDELIYKTKGMGGSETALIEMATNLKAITGRQVIVFNDRESGFTGSSGVEWRSVKEVPNYFSKYQPAAHIAWRHNIRLTAAPTYLWCHDLQTQGVESKHNFDKILCLSDFHKHFVMAMQGVPASKIIVTRNGITPAKFEFEKKPKNPNKAVFMSSPDRGLENAVRVIEMMRETLPEMELHVYYGLENLYKYGQKDKAEFLKALMASRPWVIQHGFTEQTKMYHEVSDAVLWMHPCTFIETFCITALEMLALKIFPITRRFGALQNTLAKAESNGQAILFENDQFNDADLNPYAEAGIRVIKEKLYEGIEFDMDHYGWGRVAEEWASFLWQN